MYRRRSERVTCGDEALCVFGGYELDPGPQWRGTLCFGTDKGDSGGKQQKRENRRGGHFLEWFRKYTLITMCTLQCVHEHAMNILYQAGATYHPVCLGCFVCVKVFEHV